MKRVTVIIGAIIVILMGTLLFYFYQKNQCMYSNQAPQELYPNSMGSISCDQLIKLSAAIPPALKQEVDAWVAKNKTLVSNLLLLPRFFSADEMKNFIEETRALVKDKNLSKNNYIFDIESDTAPAVIKIAGIPSRISSMVSSLGYDPYKIEWWHNDDAVRRATSVHIPTQQHITRAATQHLLAERSVDSIVPINTYVYHIEGRPIDCDDRNYLIVQEKLSGFSPLSSLTPEQKQTALNQLNLNEFYTAVKYANLWDISEDNIWFDEKLETIAYPDGEKPGNEGYGACARWKVAILGHDLEKAKYNVRNWMDGGHRGFENILTRYAPQRVEEWMELYNNDQDVKLKY